MANLSQINGKAIASISQVDGKAKTAILQVDGQNVVNNSVTWTSFYTVSGNTPGTYSFSGNVTITGASATFKIFATVYTGGPCTTSCTIGGSTFTNVTRSGPGTNTSLTGITKTPGTYAYSGSMNMSSGSCGGGIQYTQP